MGEQPRPVDAEVERGLVSMRVGFLSSSEQIAAGVAQLEAHLAELPVDEREAVQAKIARIVGAHERLIAKVGRLPPSAWDQFKIMVNVVKVQQDVLDELSNLVKEYVLPRQLENLSDAAAVQQSEPTGYRALSDAGLVRRTGSGSRARAARRDADEHERRSLLAVARERTAGFRGLLAMVIAGVALSQFPRGVKLQDLTTKLTEIVNAAGLSLPLGDPKAPADQHADTPAPPRTRAAERVPGGPDIATLSDPPAAAPAKPAKEPEQHKVAPAPKAAAAGTAADAANEAAAEPRAVRKAVADEAPGETPPARKAAAAAADQTLAAAPAEPAEEQFVPVVFTHKDYDTVMQALTDLKQQYPKILIGRKGEVQPVDLGKKGVWHRLVFLPAGPRPQAARLCDQLAAEGYDRCWVKAY
jgi:hypothetical protein